MFRTHAQASPSVTLENGITRLRPVRAKIPFKTIREEGQSASLFPTDSEHRAAAILASVAFVTLTAVCIALYFLTRNSRWDVFSLPFSPRSKLPASLSAPNELDDPFLTTLPVPRLPIKGMRAAVSTLRDPSENFLSYLPHSGFHNQRIALENALVLAYILNRTLLVPPVSLGDPPIRYRPSHLLRADIALSTKIGLEHCPIASNTAFIPEECADYWTYAHVPWEWFVDLTSVTQQHSIRTLKRRDLTDAFLHHLHLRPADTYFLNDTDPYQFRFFDSGSADDPLGSRYKGRIDLATLATLSRTHRLLQIGTLFGTTRVRVSEPVHLGLRKHVRQSMVFSNPELLAIADGVRDSDELGGAWGYAGVHLRLGDGVFADGGVRARNVRHVWWRLVRALGMTNEEALALEAGFMKKGGKALLLPPPPPSRDAVALRVPHPAPPSLPPPGLLPTCHSSVSHSLVNIPLYIATDKPSHHALSLFTYTFSCVYFISNFSSRLAKLDAISAPDSEANDGIPLASFLPPFLDAIIASKARVVIGTPGSTFSRFVEDVLWRRYHGWEIVQRG